MAAFWTLAAGVIAVRQALDTNAMKICYLALAANLRVAPHLSPELRCGGSTTPGTE